MTARGNLLQRLKNHPGDISSDSDDLTAEAANRIEQLEAQLAEANKDAARYVWLREGILRISKMSLIEHDKIVDAIIYRNGAKNV